MNDKNCFPVVVKWLAISFISALAFLIIVLSILLWKFSPIIKIDGSGVSILNGIISITDNSTTTGNNTSAEMPFSSSSSKSLGRKLLTNATIENYDNYGSLSLERVVITGKLKSYGEITAKNSTFATSNIWGSVQLENSILKNKTTIYGGANLIACEIIDNINIFGTLNAQKTVFKGGLIVNYSSSNKASNNPILSITDSNINTIIVEKPKQNTNHNGDQTPISQIIKIIGNSTVHGDITFEAGNGIVEIAKHVKMLGKVHGGVIKM